MHEALAVGVIETGANFLRDPERVLEGELPRLGETLAQRSAGDVGLHVVEQPAGVAGVDQRNDVRMGELCGDADFAEEPLGAQRRRDFRPQDFDGDFATVLFFFGEIDRRHAAAAQFPLDGVAIGECSGYRRGRTLRHGHGAKS